MGDLLIESVQATFARRKTPIPKNPPIALTEAFASDAGKILQWNAFRRKGRLSAPGLADVINKLAAFLQPILDGDAEGQVWSPETGWTESSS